MIKTFRLLIQRPIYGRKSYNIRFETKWVEYDAITLYDAMTLAKNDHPDWEMSMGWPKYY